MSNGVKKVCLIGSAAVGACTILTIGGVVLWSAVTKEKVFIMCSFHDVDTKRIVREALIGYSFYDDDTRRSGSCGKTTKGTSWCSSSISSLSSKSSSVM